MFASIRLHEMFSKDNISGTLVCTFPLFTYVIKIHLYEYPYLKWCLDSHHLIEGTLLGQEVANSFLH